METSIKIKVPIKADAEIGENWAHLQEVDKNGFWQKELSLV